MPGATRCWLRSSTPYFKSQIEFLLDFSGILEDWKKEPDLGWDERTDEEYFRSFQSYREKASQLFVGSKLKAWGEFRTERALLTFGNYLLKKGQNSSFLEDADGPISWKRLLRGEQLEDSGPKRGFVKALLDTIDLEKGVAESLDDAIATNKAGVAWRQMLVNDPRLIKYCTKRRIRVVEDWNVYLLSRERRSTDHADLFSYNCFLNEVEPRIKNGGLAPFTSANYNHAKSDAYESSFSIAATKQGVGLQIWNFGSGFCIRFRSGNQECIDKCKSHLSTVDKFTVDGNGNVKLPANQVVAAIQAIASIVDGVTAEEQK
ncbi:hypothetical protein [Rhodopirellula europaea]|uniref:hypothetical protein n=1 Tax=Rhodopirellula europaea TaxID=1263866 RepID=UPI003D2E73EC